VGGGNANEVRIDRTGAYLDDCQIVDLVDPAKDKSAAARLWALGEELVGEKFDLA
jgi:hypothetical protein